MYKRIEQESLPRPRRSKMPRLAGGVVLVAIITLGAVGLVKLLPRKAGPCDPPRLAAGGLSLPIKTVQPSKEGSYKVPTQAERAYWLEGSEINQVFVINAADDGSALRQALASGQTVTVTWADCNSYSYVLNAGQPEVSTEAGLPDQSISGITIIVRLRGGTTAPGFAVSGELQEAVISSFDTPDPSAVQTEITLGSVEAAQGGESVRITMSIANTGQAAIHMGPEDASLATENGESVMMQSSEPALPVEIGPGGMLDISFVFARPASSSATLRLLGTEYSIEGY